MPLPTSLVLLCIKWPFLRLLRSQGYLPFFKTRSIGRISTRLQQAKTDCFASQKGASVHLGASPPESNPCFEPQLMLKSCFKFQDCLIPKLSSLEVGMLTLKCTESLRMKRFVISRSQFYLLSRFFEIWVICWIFSAYRRFTKSARFRRRYC